MDTQFNNNEGQSADEGKIKRPRIGSRISRATTKRRMPAATMASTVRCNKHLLPTRSRHLGRSSVSGRRREAMPAASITAIIVVRFSI